MELSGETLWSAAQEQLQSMLNPDLFKLWFAPIKVAAMDHQALTLEVANDFCEVWLTDNYHSLIQDVVRQVSGKPMGVCFRVSRDAALHPQPAATSGSTQRGRGRSLVRSGQHLEESPTETLFNPHNTFDTFVVGNNNTFAHAAAKAVAQTPGRSYNPLFLFGGVGLGKTHLLHAIGHEVAQNRKGARVTYVSSEKFTNEFIDAIQNSQLVRFRRKYRQSDVFLIDDIQFLAGKERIQEEFFHTFNTLHESRRQIVLTCDRPANEIQNLEQRLVSRFEWGLVTDMQPPDVETRVAILRKKAQFMQVTLPLEILNFLAQRIRTNIRRLEGALVRVASYSSLTGHPLTIEKVEELLREVLQEEGRFTITIDVIQKKVADHFDLRLADMTSKRRPENIVFPRQIAMYLARQLTGNSLSSIGEAFGGRDHGTVLHACRLVKDRMHLESGIRQVVSYLEKQLLR